MILKPAGKFSAVVSELAEGWRAATLALALLLIFLVVCGLPFATPDSNRAISHKAGPFTFLVCALVYTWRSGRAAATAPERRFWKRLGAGFAVWAATYLPSLLYPLPGQLDPVRPYLDFGFAIAFVLVIAAIEERPDDRSPIAELGRRPALASTTLVMVAFFSTVVVLPTITDSPGVNVYFSSFGFWVAMDLGIAGRLFYFALQSSSSRWRWTYTALGTAFTLIMAVDLLTAWLYPHHLPLTSGRFYDALWTLPYAVLLTAAASGLLRIDERRGREREPTLSDAFAASPLVWALFFPGLHFLADRTGWLDPALQRQRDLMVMFWTLVLMGVAIWRQHRVEKGLERLVRERREIDESLRDSEKDLRLLVERARVAERLQAAEERFAKAFEVSPEALVLSTFADGTILDVNPAFERLSLLSRADCVGRLAAELGFWPRARNRERLIQLLQRRRQMHDLPGELRRADGRLRSVRVSYERISEGDGDLLLSVLRDGDVGAATRSERIATLLENIRIPLRLLSGPPEGGENALFVNAGARLALRRQRDSDVEVRGPSGLRLLLHLRGAESELP